MEGTKETAFCNNEYSSYRGRGALIVIEGLDHSGKTTQCRLLVDRLKKMEFSDMDHSVRFPNRETPSGQIIDQYLKSKVDLPDESIHLFFSANRWETIRTEQILSKLAMGQTVVMDRYAFSGAAFSMAKGMDKEWCKNPDRGLPKPDLVVFLDLPEESAKERSGFGGERYETSEFQKRVSERFKELRLEDTAKYNSGDSARGVNWVVVDAGKSIKMVECTISHHVITAITAASKEPLFPLWWNSEKPIKAFEIFPTIIVPN